MTWKPPERNPNLPLRQCLPEAGWREVIVEIATRHGLFPCELTPFEKGETIVWRAGEHVVKLTIPECQYQIDAEVGCLTATQDKLSLATPRLRWTDEISGWPYVVMDLVPGRPLSDVWSELDRPERVRIVRRLGEFCRELHSLDSNGFPTGWDDFWQGMSSDVGRRHASRGGPPHLLGEIDAFMSRVGPLDDGRRVPLHTELMGPHLYVEMRDGRLELCGLIDFADARVGPPLYEFSSLVEFLFKGERGLLREFLLAYGVRERELTPAYSERLLAWTLCQRFSTLGRLLKVVEPEVPSSLHELAVRLFGVE